MLTPYLKNGLLIKEMSLIININITSPTQTNTLRFRIRTTGHQILNHIFHRNLSVNIDVSGTGQLTLSYNWLSSDEIPSSFEEQDIVFDNIVRYPTESRSDSVSSRSSDTEPQNPPTLRELLEQIEIGRRFQDSPNESDYGDR